MATQWPDLNTRQRLHAIALVQARPEAPVIQDEPGWGGIIELMVGIVGVVGCVVLVWAFIQ